MNLLAADQIGWAALQIHDRQDSNAAWSDGVQQGVGETVKEPPPDLTLDHGASLWMLLDRTLASLNLVQERATKARCLELVILSRLVQLALREPMKGGSPHSLELGSRIAEYGSCRTARPGSRVPLRVAAFCLVCPEP